MADARVRKAGKGRPGRKPSAKAVRELADALKSHRPGTPWKFAAPNPLQAGEIAKKAAWLTSDKLHAPAPESRKDKAYRQQAIKARALLANERLAAGDELDSQVRRVRGRILKARQRRT